MSGTRQERFEVDGGARIELNLPSGAAVFLPSAAGVVEVTVEGREADEFVIEEVGGRILLHTPRSPRSRWDFFDVTVRMPPGCHLEVRAASADVRAEVDLGALKVDVASGDVAAGDVAGNATVQAASGEVKLGVVSGDLAVNTASGDIRVREVGGRAVLDSASGDVRVGSALGVLAASTQSGDLEVDHYGGGDLRCGSTSGDVRIGLPPGMDLDVDIDTLSGDIRSDFSIEPGDIPPPPAPPSPTDLPTGDTGRAARLRVKTVSGDVTLARANTR